MNAILIPVVIGTVFLMQLKTNSEVSYVTSNVDGNSYLVQNLPDKQQSADILASIANKLSNLVDQLYQERQKYPQYDKAIQLMKNRFRSQNITEGGQNHDYTTYTLNKGQEISFCLRTRDKDNSLHDTNLITFVALHELAHIASVQDDPQHRTTEFKENFKFIVKKAVEQNIWQYTDFRTSPRMYCGTLVNSVPI